MKEIKYQEYAASLRGIKPQLAKGVALALGCTAGNPKRTPLFYLTEELENCFLYAHNSTECNKIVQIIMQGFLEMYTKESLSVVYVRTNHDSYWDKYRYPLDINFGSSRATVLQRLANGVRHRYASFREFRVNSLNQYNLKAKDSEMVREVVIIPELCDLSEEEFVQLIELVDSSSGLGIHFILCTGKLIIDSFFRKAQVKLTTYAEEKISEMLLGNNAATKLPNSDWLISSRAGIQVTTQLPSLTETLMF